MPTVTKVDPKTNGAVIKSVDDALAEHLRIAEEHLIKAVELFARKHKPDRTLAYIKRLMSAQETITSLYREELVRIRGPVKKGRKR